MGICLWILVGSWFLFPPPPAFVERYFNHFWYPWLLRCLVPGTQSTPIPLVLFFVAAFLVWIGVLGIRKWIYFQKEAPNFFWKWIIWIFQKAFYLVPISLLWLIAFWGAGYRRQPVENRLHFDSSAITGREAEELRSQLLGVVNRDLVPPEDRDGNRAIAAISASMSEMAAGWDGTPIKLPYRVKPTPRGLLLSGNTAGACSPFTLEALVDSALPETAYVYTAAHELGHIAGFCAEDEATFAGYVAGLRSGDRFARYACALDAYVDLVNQLRGTEAQTALRALPYLARQDLAKADQVYREYRVSWFTRIQVRAYNRYLQVQGIEEGLGNYSHGIILFACAWRKGMVSLGGLQ
jgi:hypothetical protein